MLAQIFRGLGIVTVLFSLFTVIGLNTAKAESAAEIAAIELQLMVAAPAAVVKNATLMVPGKDKKLRVVRKGKGGFICVLGTNLICMDKNTAGFFKAKKAKKLPSPGKIGFSYMLAGGNGGSNTDPYAEKMTPDNHWVKSGPHVMLVGSVLDGYPRDDEADPTQPYVMWSGTPYEHLMIPIR